MKRIRITESQLINILEGAELGDNSFRAVDGYEYFIIPNKDGRSLDLVSSDYADGGEVIATNLTDDVETIINKMSKDAPFYLLPNNLGDNWNWLIFQSTVLTNSGINSCQRALLVGDAFNISSSEANQYVISLESATDGNNEDMICIRNVNSGIDEYYISKERMIMSGSINNSVIYFIYDSFSSEYYEVFIMNLNTGDYTDNYTVPINGFSEYGIDTSQYTKLSDYIYQTDNKHILLMNTYGEDVVTVNVDDLSISTTQPIMEY